jgi:hypothetical protein
MEIAPSEALSSPPVRPDVSVIVPARNEEACLGRCLESLVAQQGIAFEVIVVDDSSNDRTAEIGRSFRSVRLVSADPLPPGWAGKSNAAFTGARHARAPWLLFTDADTVHLPGSLAGALEEAKSHGAALLSYSPAQEVHSFGERAVMPVIFSELACTYKPREICDPKSQAVAANGQYLLISREAYDAIGGHAAVAASLLEDVELARLVKQRGYCLRFRFGGDAVRTRMYLTFKALLEGWTKNLALLFPNATKLALLRLAEFAAIAAGAIATIASIHAGLPLLAMASAGTGALYGNFLRRVRRAHFGTACNLLAYLGLPFFSSLLLRSAIYYRFGRQVSWKGRLYAAMPATQASSTTAAGQTISVQ